jgi:hypothetical protein
MYCIACAFENRGWTNMHTHWKFQPSFSILLMDDEIVVPRPKVSRQNLVHHVCCSHVITTRGTLGILVGSMQLTPNPCSPLYVTPLLPANCMGKTSHANKHHEHHIPWTCAFFTMHHVKCTICSYAQASCVHLHVHHTLCTATWALKCASLHCCTKYPLFIDIQSYVSWVHHSSNLKLFMWENIFWNSCMYPSFQVILLAIHKQLRANRSLQPCHPLLLL